MAPSRPNPQRSVNIILTIRIRHRRAPHRAPVHRPVHRHPLPRPPQRLRRSKLRMIMNREVSWTLSLVRTNERYFASADFLIGYGAFGVIWAVTDPRTGRRVALKKMPHVFQSVVAARRAFREIKMLCTFRHENVSESVSLRSASLRIESFAFRFFKRWIFSNHQVKLISFMKCTCLSLLPHAGDKRSIFVDIFSRN